jgi:hypothetical protein
MSSAAASEMYGWASDVNLQTTLAAANPPVEPPPLPHHPIMCRDDLLWLEEDGRMGCSHVQVPAGDPRTQGCVDQSIAILILELAVEKERP